ncbi:hypothetical protein [Frankia sp. EUN1f]|uniref:hypothetical protein n=1 Tax=Parafrankia sp. EUN1f TaxID=102897 RepID=UPI0001C4684B|nr:hypothetical protein FrEUN1fDRAFT_6126 [Parafrankia sp. EUN1f]
MSVDSAHEDVPALIRLTDRACTALRANEMIVFDWAVLGLCCGCAGQPWLRTAPRSVTRRYRGFRPLDTDPPDSAVAHPRAYPYLVGRAIAVDCRRRFGLRRFSCDLPPDVGLAGLSSGAIRDGGP